MEHRKTVQCCGNGEWRAKEKEKEKAKEGGKMVGAEI